MSRLQLLILTTVVLFCVQTGFAQDSVSEEVVTPEIQVLGQSRDKRSVSDFIPTVGEISGRRLDRRKQQTIGETLSREAGVSSSFFGPNASRPVIRGLEGERIRILQNGIGTLDASGTSPDHAVALDPCLIDRVEIVRGSAALLYGNSAIGGVVNTVTQRIPDRLRVLPTARLDSQFSSVNRGRSACVSINSSVGKIAFHLDGVIRAAENYSVPDFVRSERLRSLDPIADEPRNKVANSALDSFEGAVGASYILDKGYLGASVSGFGSEYGTVAEPDVRIDMKRQRLDLSGEFKELGWVESARIKGAVSHYKHTEFEGEEVGTVFRNRGAESRLDVKHRSVGPVGGILGFQQQYFNFSAIGEEAFLPTTKNSSYAAFIHEELSLGDWTPSLGARIDRSSVRTEEGDLFGASVLRQFWATSLSAGLLYRFDPSFSLGLSTAFNERAPNFQELFSNGPHIATGTFERGDANLGKELGRSVELSLRSKTQSGEGRLSAFVQDYSRFVALVPTGEEDVESELSIFEYTPVEARFVGAEFEYRQQLPWTIGSGSLEAELRVDWVRAWNRTSSTNLPRITPFRESAALYYRTNHYGLELEIQRSEAQSLVAPNELPTDSFTFVNLGADAPIRVSFVHLSLFARAHNLFDVEGRSHVSLLKDLAPLPGRNFIIGLQARM